VTTSAKRTTRRLFRLVAAIVMAGVIGLFVIPASPASATATGKCYGASCTGLDPTNRCDGDAYTVYSMGLTSGPQYAGQLDLRYSPSCKANWGRFTAPTGLREATLFSAGSPVPISGRVTAWNPGGPSQGTIQGNVARLSFRGYTTWSRMVDGRGTACTGVEIYFGDNSPSGNVESRGWWWGPCA
jgi:hypothetical protein